MAYSKTNWVNENEPAINADNLNKIESGIEDNSLQLESYGRTINEIINNKVETNAIKNEASTEDDEIYSSNYLNDKLVSVGTTAPTDGRRVWFKKSKNLINYEDFTGTITNYYFKGLPSTNFSLKAGKTYTLSFDIVSSVTPFAISVGAGTTGYAVDIKHVYNYENGRNSITFTPTETQLTNGNILHFRAPRYGTSQSSVTFTISNVQLEEGSSATTYEPYVEPSINVDEEELHFDNYSTSEQVIGKWIDGKPLYRKVITFGALANNGNKVVPYGSSNNLIKFDIYAKNTTAGYLFKVPLGGTNYINSYVDLNSHQIVVQTNSDRTNVTDNYAIVEYTKTTD